MLKPIIIIIIALIGGIVIYASTKPDTFRVERSIVIKAPPEKIFPLINDFHLWEAWTPYNKDPDMKKTHSGSDRGKGAHYAWEGNKDAGTGEITISEATPPNKLVFDLHMIKPFEGRNVTEISLIAEGDFTRVTWSLVDKHNLMLKTMSIFINMDKAIGKDFELGLARLKTVVEK
ncbi:MAG: polyketide cyclase [Rhodospirillales bacterium]|nr:MAG: polyketide cyclase [Rhodospirillales bacterium]